MVESLVFSERLPPDPKTPWRTDIPLSASHAFRYWHARWQPGAYFLREIEAPDAVADLQTPGLLAVQFEDQCWFHYGRGWGDDFIDIGVAPSNNVCVSAFLNTDVLRQVMTLGLMHSEVGSVEWSGNQFRVRKATRDYRITGEIQPSPAGTVESLRVTYSATKGDVHWVIRYIYGTRSPANGLPSAIRCFWLDGTREVQRLEFVIHALKLSATALGLAAYEPAPFIASNIWQRNLFTNNAIYAILPGGELKRLESLAVRPPRNPPPGRASTGQFALVYSAWAGANLWIFILAVRMIRRQTQKPKT